MDLQTLAVINQLIPSQLSTNSWWLILSEDNGYLESVVAYGKRQIKTLGIPRKKLEFARISVSQINRAPVWTDDYSDLFRLLKHR